ncbi:poly(3-hydroxyalkanoate) synthetase [Pseudomonas indoloxydans]|uniref:Poly(3-hydroxyalkanoate) synthetase n=1 Tax=Ectopseudomonas oleovorans TaxID=301 RepID=A0A2T5PPZ4_ECTOL|nr:DUF3141 domain-containing protein [Pseudomonas indoloxydans]PTU79808.1 poly(3-hydroxyalkanoate) synthetase [Pseudomonas indoloxydans]
MVSKTYLAMHEDRFSSFQGLLDHLGQLQRLQLDIVLEALGQRQKKVLAPILAGRLQQPSAEQCWEYLADLSQRTLLYWDTLRQRGDNTLAHERAGYPLVLKFAYEVLIDGRDLPHPVNYSLLRILPPEDLPVDEQRRPVIVIDPRGGHGAGIGGFKQDSEIGESLRAGHPTYFIAFSHSPEAGQTLLDIAEAEARFIEHVSDHHPDADKPVVIGNCQAGWALMGLAAARPELPGLVIINGAPLSYWAGVNGRNPMRYAGGLLGGAWMTRFGSDLGNGRFDGTWLVSNFESLNPANALWTKYYNLFSKVDSEAPRFLEFERWWGSPTLLNSEEIETIVDDLFIGNRLASGLSRRSTGIDLRRIEAPVVVFCSYGDNITPPQQALNWIADVYPSDLALRSAGRTIVYLRHASIGHLGIFVSGQVARREHRQLLGAVEAIGLLPPGLFELVIDDLPGASPNAPAEYAVHFESRKIADILADDQDGRDDEHEFALVQRASELNSTLYDWLVRPWMRQVVNEPLADLSRRLHPFHQQQIVWSSLNPALWWLPGTAERVRENRRPAPSDNPLFTWQDWTASLVEAQLDTYRDIRDAMQEMAFHVFYGGLSTLTGGKRPVNLEDRAPYWDQALAARLEDALPRGGSLEGLARILSLLGQGGGKIGKERIEQLARQGRALIEPHDIDPLALRDTVRLQGLLVFAHPEESLKTLPLLIPVEERQQVLDAVVQLVPELKSADNPAAELWRELHRVLEHPLSDFAPLTGARQTQEVIAAPQANPEPEVNAGQPAASDQQTNADQQTGVAQVATIEPPELAAAQSTAQQVAPTPRRTPTKRKAATPRTSSPSQPMPAGDAEKPNTDTAAGASTEKPKRSQPTRKTKKGDDIP